MTSDDLEGDDADLPRTGRHGEGLLDAADLQDVDAACTELDGTPDGDAVDQATVELVLTVDLGGRQQAGDGGGGEEGVDLNHGRFRR